MLHLLQRFGKAAILIEITAATSLFYVFHEINTGGPDARQKWDNRLPFLIDALYKVTGDERVVEHRTIQSKKLEKSEK